MEGQGAGPPATGPPIQLISNVTPIENQTAEFDQLDYSTVARMLMTRRTVPQWLMVPVTNGPLSLEGPLSLDGAKRLIGVNLQTFSCTSVTCGCRSHKWTTRS
jgi:hypothetical protein